MTEPSAEAMEFITKLRDMDATYNHEKGKVEVDYTIIDDEAVELLHARCRACDFVMGLEASATRITQDDLDAAVCRAVEAERREWAEPLIEAYGPVGDTLPWKVCAKIAEALNGEEAAHE